MRRLRLEKATRTKRCQPRSNRWASCRRPVLASEGLSSGSAAAAALSISDARWLRFEKVATTKRCQACNRSMERRSPALANSSAVSSNRCGATSPSNISAVRLCRLKREKALRTKRSQACNRSASRRPLFANDGLSPGHCGATSVLKLSGVRLSTVSLPVAPLLQAPPASISDGRPGRQTPRASHFFEPITDAIERFDHVEVVVGPLELLAQPLDVAVDGAIVHVDLVVVGGIHQRVAALDHAGPAGERLQDQELGDRERHWLILPGAGVALRVHAQQAAFEHLGGIGLLRRAAVLRRRAA